MGKWRRNGEMYRMKSSLVNHESRTMAAVSKDTAKRKSFQARIMAKLQL
jgi:hypothetical protein